MAKAGQAVQPKREPARVLRRGLFVACRRSHHFFITVDAHTHTHTHTHTQSHVNDAAARSIAAGKWVAWRAALIESQVSERVI